MNFEKKIRGSWLLLMLITTYLIEFTFSSTKMHCREPDQGSLSRVRGAKRKFVLITGAGAGIGNYLIFYPAAYYFAALTGREILIQDGSLLAEMCSIIVCGFPLYSEMAAAIPSQLSPAALRGIVGAKAWDMQRHMNGERILDDILIRADGYKYASGWYLGYNHTDECISRLTGCAHNDVSCHDRHALQKLIRGPFKNAFSQSEESKIIGVPTNLKHAIMTLPHSYAPRLDASIHLRSQFQYFEQLVGMWALYWYSTGVVRYC
jgi:hypothetical protein